MKKDNSQEDKDTARKAYLDSQRGPLFDHDSEGESQLIAAPIKVSTLHNGGTDSNSHDPENFNDTA